MNRRNEIVVTPATCSRGRQIMREYGLTHQVEKLAEEALELALACRRYITGREGLEEALCELSDVCLVGWQVLDAGGDKAKGVFDHNMRDKSVRQIKRIGGRHVFPESQEH